MTKKYFGTDGIRGLVGKAPITPEFALKLGWAAGKVFGANGKGKVLIGKDTRISGYMLETALEAGLIASGVDAGLLGPMPTPAIAYLTKTFRADAGIVISASHNPYYDNGIKFFSKDGTKLPDEIEFQIEALLEQEITCVSSDQLGKAFRINDAAGRYIEFCKSRFAPDSLNGMTIVVDSANGATYHIAPEVFSELGANVIPIFNKPNGININEKCGATHTEELRKQVLEHKADVGIALDGDGDRIIMVDENGIEVDGDELVYIVARHALTQGKLNGGVVGTLMSNLGLEVALKKLSIPFKRANVGDRYVMQLLKENNWSIGGEGSGHVINLEHIPTGDGVVSGIQVLAAMVETGMSLSELKSGMEKYPQKLINVRYADNKAPLNVEEVKQAIADAEQELGEDGRILIRKSGTEPLIRVMTEGKDADLIVSVAEKVAQKVREFA
ncbi:phosphoglucosamine mutase [Psychrosphaera saromensis]|uniref:Phosphoglucosamine mutase n=1 Tax=Psychrosphaera saromensis TaxID=716813 RepID=A0A2S7UUX0_9GAMM|nr:phosphoglucosamine mutase [Psychrosphaera saromensis]PQJ53525.1 phosphoglucosamine mutase [Psychrosphaera saromensis]GHB64580.1 phosphoglucosamine mutase [Psychrosphaera saromensis]GLQ15721.1 phosphoglucosamine mutase [Psychrosphaera saromensis]